MQGGQTTSRKNRLKLAEGLCKDTEFTKHECECLLDLYGKYARPKMDRGRFRDFLHDTFHMTDDIIMDRVFRAFNKDAIGIINMEEWVKGLSVFLNNNLSAQIDFCFTVFDINGDGFISREDMYTLLKNCLVKTSSEEDPDEGVKELIDILMKILANQNKVSPEAYKKAVEDEKLLLECLGACLPSAADCEAFREQVFQEANR